MVSNMTVSYVLSATVVQVMSIKSLKLVGKV